MPSCHRRIRLALEVDSLDEISDRIRSFIDVQPPQNLLEKLKMLPKLAEVGSFFPKTAKTGPCKEVISKDELIAEWDHEPFQIEWSPGDQLTVEVYDGRAGLFAQPRRFVLAPSPSEPREFPLKPGTFPLQAEAQKPDPRVDPRNVSIVLGSRRVGELRSQDRDHAPPSTAARPDDGTIVIK